MYIFNYIKSNYTQKVNVNLHDEESRTIKIVLFYHNIDLDRL